MTWRDTPIPNDDTGHPMFRGKIGLFNDKDERIASILWFREKGPFYAHAMDVNDTSVTRRIGPHETLEAAKQSCLDAIEGRIDISNRAGYPR